MKTESGESGYTLIELMITIAIITIVAASTLTMPPLLEKNSVQSYTQEIRALLVKARNDASNFNTSCTVTLAANQVQIAQDKNRDGTVETATKNYPKFAINFSAANNPILFDRRGLTNDNQTIFIDSYTAGLAPAVDCIVVSATRINVGRMNGGNCDQQ